MPTRYKTAAGIISLVCACLLLAGCSVTNTPSSSYVGSTLQFVLDHGPGNVASLDVTRQLLLNQAADGTPPGGMVVIAACYEATTHQLDVAVIPSAEATPKILERGSDGQYDSLLGDECE